MIFDISVNASETEVPDLKIICHKIESEGIVSAYEDYIFEIENNSEYSIIQPQWSYLLPLKGGGKAEIATSDDVTFTIPVVKDRSKYSITADYIIEGTITLNCMVNGMEKSATYELHLDLKPKIISYSEIVKTANETKTTYSIDFTVRYTGKDYLRVGVREDYSPFLEIETVEEPYVAHVHRNGINTFDYAWVILSVENEYGKDEVIITLEKWDGNTGMDNNLMEESSCGLADAFSVKVYSKTGKYIMWAKDKNELKRLTPDVYILQLCDGKDVCYKTIKYMCL
ncbi:hypothetical protein [Bacteroides sp.]